jgi:rhodanese-related sulfurtransferase
MTEHKDRSGVDNVTEAEAMEKMKGKAPEDFLLLDVRYDNEYEAKRLPGSRLIPVDELEDRIDEIESETDKLTIVCCNNGNRSYDASLILLEEGFSEVYNLGDGVERWEGIKAFGAQTAIIRQFHSLDNGRMHVSFL